MALPKSRRFLVAAAPLAALLAYLLLWPVPIEPVAWEPPPHRPRDGKLAPNARLRGRTILAPEAKGPEAIAFDAEGRLHAGLLDGRIVRVAGDGALETIAHTAGRPLGLKFAPDGRLFVADADRGLLAIGADGAVTVLATEHGGVPFRFTDDLAIAPDGTIYFTDASSRFGVVEYRLDILEHGPSGRLLAYKDGRTELVLDGLTFANGVALSPDGAFALVAETSSYRVRRVWLAGPRKGEHEVLVDALPGFPDNVTYAPGSNRYWIALGSPRNPLIDFMAPWPFLRKVVARLPKAVQPAPVRHSIALAIDGEGNLLEYLEDESPAAYAPVASVLEHGGKLYLGSFATDGLAVAPAP